MVMSKILSTLPEQYKYFLTAWESTPISDKTITNLTSRLVAEELRNKVRENDIPIAFKSSEKITNLTSRLVAEELRNKVRENDIPIAFKSSEKQCYKCKSKGHINEEETENIQLISEEEHSEIEQKENESLGNAEDSNETGTGRSLGEGNDESTTETRTGSMG
ncbi:hypothetical protein QE152_g4842 [Popillia japonica]|uniref:Uncharacterized protein n=1 Tax=Popillia japonica TaxID=7064 RepID=A0AAW1N194_POPJA